MEGVVRPNLGRYLSRPPPGRGARGSKDEPVARGVVEGAQRKGRGSSRYGGGEEQPESQKQGDRQWQW